MTREVYNKMNEVLSAYLNGVVVQHKTQKPDDPFISVWIDVNKFEELAYLEKEPYNYRVKPASEYVPFKNAGEFIDALQKHGNFVKHGNTHYFPVNIDNSSIMLRFYDFDSEISFEELLDKEWKFADGTLCGKLINN